MSDEEEQPARRYVVAWKLAIEGHSGTLRSDALTTTITCTPSSLDTARDSTTMAIAARIHEAYVSTLGPTTRLRVVLLSTTLLYEFES